MDYIEKLCSIFTDWCESNNIEPDSASAILQWGDINENQSKWLKKFIRIWKKAEKL